MKPFRGIWTLKSFADEASGDFSFLWYGDKSTLYRDSFTFTMPHSYRVGHMGVKGSAY